MVRGICQLCVEENDLISSHVFPEFFYTSTYDESHRYVSVTDHPRHKPRMMQKGLREDLFCPSCECQFSRYESYSSNLLRRVDAAVGNVTGGVAVSDVNFTLFRLFGLSLLWRLHVARSHMFGQVNLGPRAERLRTMLRTERPGDPHEFGFALAKVTGLETHGEMIISPVTSNYLGRLAYYFMARGYDWMFVVSRDSAGLQKHFPFVGSTERLFVPTRSQDQQALFSKLRRAFPDSLGKAPRVVSSD